MPSLREDVIYAIVLAVLIFYAKVSFCNNLPGDSVVNSISDKSIQGTRLSVLSVDESSELEPSFEEEEDEDNFESDDRTYDPDKILKYYEEQSRNYSKTTQKPVLTSDTTPHHKSTLPPPSSCSGSCSDKEARESAALDSFRKQLLARLGMEHAPNVTGSQKIPVEILREFCKSRYLPPEYCTGSTTSNKSHEYQSDSPRHYDENDLDVFEEEGEVVQYMSSESRIFAFPNSTIKPRHKRHLIFDFIENQKTNNAVLQAMLHIFVHSRKYLLDNNIKHPSNMKFIDIEIAKVLKGATHTRVYENYRNISIPQDDNGDDDDGKYIQLNVTDLVTEWFHSPETSHSIIIKIEFNGVQVPHRVLSLNLEDTSRSPYIDIVIKDQRKIRTKRSSLKCSRESNEKRCCRHPLTVDFERFGWDWVIAPKKYDANYCAGECKIAFMQKYPHTHVVQLSTAANPCCSPRKMSSIELLYFDEKLNIVLSKIPHMIVEDCFCA